MRVNMRGAVLGLRYLSQSGNQEVGPGAAIAQMPIRVSVLAASGAGVAECAHPDLVSVFDPDLHEWPELAGSSDGPCGHSVSAARQLFPLGGRLGTGAAVDERATAGEVARTFGWDRPLAEP